MQYFTFVFEVIMMLSIAFGNTMIKIFAVISYCLRFFIIIFWGSFLMYKYDSHIGPKIGDSPNKDDQLALYFVMFITVREITTFPLLYLKQQINDGNVSRTKVNHARSASNEYQSLFSPGKLFAKFREEYGGHTDQLDMAIESDK